MRSSGAKLFSGVKFVEAMLNCLHGQMQCNCRPWTGQRWEF